MSKKLVLLLFAILLPMQVFAINTEELEQQKQKAMQSLKELEAKYHQQEGIIIALDYLITQEKAAVDKAPAEEVKPEMGDIDAE